MSPRRGAAFAACAAFVLLIQVGATWGGGAMPQARAQAAAPSAAPSQTPRPALPAGHPPLQAKQSDSFLPLVIVDTPAQLIGASGHGLILDRRGNELKLTEPLIRSIQEAILEELNAVPLVQLPPDVQKALGEAQALLKAPNTAAEDAIYLRGGLIKATLSVASQTLINEYAWRSAAIITHRIGGRIDWTTTINPSVIAILKRIGFFEPPPPTTDYIEECRALGVPIPPDWSETSTQWRLQGLLTTNMLRPTPTPEYAAVWTYSDPVEQGACIALPRGTGSAGSLAGIICQSAETGHACFWDNKLRAEEPERALGWRGVTLRIADLRDGTNLMGDNCTQCHRGNNVFLIAPDDPTWAKALLRAPLAGDTGNFNTRVVTSFDNRGGPRYIPNPTPRPGWENVYSPTAGCATGCHEAPVAGQYRFPSMPPACAPGGNPALCYGR